MEKNSVKKTVYVIEPFYGGSHKQLIDFLQIILHKDNFHLHLFTLPAKKWHWRARTAALYFAQNIPKISSECENKENQKSSTTFSETFLFCSSVLNLAEFIALRPDIAKSCDGRKIIYYHENQLTYPVQTSRGDRDFQYGYNQIISALSADKIFFNSSYNLTSFLDNINSFFKQQPDFRPSSSDLKQEIQRKSTVLYFPVLVKLLPEMCMERKSQELRIVWPHRWEHDKNPQDFFECLFKLHSQGFDFKVSVLGESFQQAPEIFDQAKRILSEKLLHFGRVDCKEEYYSILRYINKSIGLVAASNIFFHNDCT